MGIAVAQSIMDYRGIAADSRDVQPGFLFAALPGTKADGARFIADAVNRGAVAVLGKPEAAETARAHGVAFVSDSNPRRRLALMAGEFFVDQPAQIAAVTGTNGKTSVVSFLRQIWAHLGHKAASLGTLGIDAPSGHVPLGHTTPDPVKLHAQLARLKHEGVDHLALEASSHGLDQYRLDGVRVAAAGFSNITRDHLDYHTDFAHYFSAKMRLFADLLVKNGVAVVDADTPHSDEVASIAAKRASQVLTVGVNGKSINLLSRTPHDSGQKIELRHDGRDYAINLPLVGEFQVSNALIAAGLAIGLGESAERVFAALKTFKGAPGRMELVAFGKSRAPIYVDYAHTPDAMETVLRALRPHVNGKLIIVFGCGGDRDKGKRPLMGSVACNFADAAIVTDDNPRGEDPAAIRREALAGCPGATEIGDRRTAIQVGIEMLGRGDSLILAGKGHEQGQIVGTEVLPYSERVEAVRIAQALGGQAAGETRSMNDLWTAGEAEIATGGKANGDWKVGGISIDTRTLKEGDLFVALKGENRDGHAFVASALEKGAGAALISNPASVTDKNAPLLLVEDTLVGLEALGRAARDRSSARIVAVTGSAGKTTTKEMLRLALFNQGKVAASAASYNNHWGVPLSLARMARDTSFGVFEIGMNHAGEIRSLVRQVRPQVAAITTITPAHIEYFGTLEAISDAKAEIFEGVEPGGVAVLPLDNPLFRRLAQRASEARVENILSFGTGMGADARLLNVKTDGEKQFVTAEICGTMIEFVLGALGGHIASNALAVLLAVQALGADLDQAASALGTFAPLKGRGARVALGDVELIDESYNANPASMSAALDLLKEARPGSTGRRIAVLGDMLELGADGPELHRAIENDIAASDVDLVFLCGPQMRALWEVLPGDRRGAYAENSKQLKEPFQSQLRSGDIVLVKGSFGSRMSVIIEALKARAAAETV